MKIGFAGAGNMAAAMARGWARPRAGRRRCCSATSTPTGRGRWPTRSAGRRGDSLAALAADSDVVLLAVKPAALDAVAEELGRHRAAVLSVLAATPLARLARGVPGRPGAARDAQPAGRGRRRGALLRGAARAAGQGCRRARPALLGELGDAGRGRRGADRRGDGGDVLRARLRRPVRAGARRRRRPRGPRPRALARARRGDARRDRRACSPARHPTRSSPRSRRRAGRPRPGSRRSHAGGFTGAIDAAVEASLERFR